MKVLFLVDSDFTTAQLVVENITLIKEKPVNFFWKMLSLLQPTSQLAAVALKQKQNQNFLRKANPFTTPSHARIRQKYPTGSMTSRRHFWLFKNKYLSTYLLLDLSHFGFLGNLQQKVPSHQK